MSKRINTSDTIPTPRIKQFQFTNYRYIPVELKYIIKDLEELLLMADNPDKLLKIRAANVDTILDHLLVFKAMEKELMEINNRE